MCVTPNTPPTSLLPKIPNQQQKEKFYGRDEISKKVTYQMALSWAYGPAVGVLETAWG